jgi:hypothetical protein
VVQNRNVSISSIWMWGWIGMSLYLRPGRGPE